MSLTRGVALPDPPAALGSVSRSAAQTPAWPTRPLKIIIPTAPGGSPDMVSRTLGAKLTERLGQPVIVESVTHGIIQGNSMVSRSAPDGHTFAMLTGGFTTQAAVVKTLPYHPVRDFAFVSTVVAYPMFISVAPGSPMASFQDLIDRARAGPEGQLRDHRRRQRLSSARQMDREPRRRQHGPGALPRLGRLHRRDRRPARRHDRHRDLGHPAHPQRPAAAAGGVVAGALSADAGHPDDGRDRPRHPADVVARDRRRAANAAPDRRSAQRRAAARARAATTSSSGWRKPGYWRRPARRRNSGGGSRPRSGSTPRSRRPTASRPNRPNRLRSRNLIFGDRHEDPLFRRLQARRAQGATRWSTSPRSCRAFPTPVRTI